MRVKMTLAAAALAALLTALLSAPATARSIHVGPGDSIQAAVNGADLGDTIKIAAGIYHQNVQIKKDGITLNGAGSSKTVLQGGGTGTPVDDVCTGEEGGFVGICVADATVSQNGPPTVNREIAGVRINRLAVEGFGGDGVFFFGARDQRVSHVVASDNGGYGIVAFETTGGRYWSNVTPRNHEAGIYVGDSPEANAVVRNNVSYANVGFGIFIRDAANGVVKGNDTYDNCVGILFVDTPDEPGAPPRPNHDWIARHNGADHNNAACPPSEEGPPISGLGIAIAGAQRITLFGNTANDNIPSGDTLASAGIAVFSFSEGGAPPIVATGNTVAHNTAFGNSPVDLLWDQQGDNAFVGNRCATSNPDGLCTGKGGHVRGHENHGNQGLGESGNHGHGHGNGKHGKHAD
jgi:Right handed beta helix region